MAALMLTGPQSASITALSMAANDPTALPLALDAINAMPALKKRRLLALLAAVL